MQERSTRKRKKMRTMRRVRSFILFIVILGLVFGWRPLLRVVKPLLGLGSAHLERVVSIPFAGNDTNGYNSVYVIDDQLCILEKDKVTVFNDLGEYISEEPFKANKPVIRDNGSQILLGDLDLGEYLILNRDGQIAKTSHDLGKLDDLWLTPDQKIMALVDDRKHIQIVDYATDEQVDVEVPNGRIIDIRYSEADQRMAVLVLETETTPYKSSIYQYAPNGELIGVTNFDAGILFDAQYDASGLVVISDHSLAAVDSFAEVPWETEVEGIINKFAWNAKWIVLNTILTEESIIDTDQTNKLGFYTWSGELQKTLEVNIDIEGMNADHHQYLVYYGKQELVLLDKKGEVLLQKTVRSPIQKVEWIAKNRLVLIYNNEVELLNLAY